MTSIFIGLSLFFPRLTLLFYWLENNIPANDTPLIVDLIGAIFAPHLLVAWWMYVLGLHPLLIGFFVIAGLLELGGGSSASSRRKDS